MCWRGLLAPWELQLVVPVVKPPQVSSKERGLQMKWLGSTSDAEQAHECDKNYLTLGWHHEP